MTIGNSPDYKAPGPGFAIVNKFGRNPDIDTATTPEDVWPGGGLYPFIDKSVPVLLEVVSDSINDAVGGTGANTVQVDLLDANGAEVAVTVEMDGITPVAIPTALFMAVNRALVLTAGSLGENAGTILIRDAGAGTTRAVIPFNAALGGGAGQTLQAVYTVPAGKRGVIRRHWARLQKAPATTAEGRIVIRPFGGAWNTKETFPITSTLSHDVVYPCGGIVLTEKTDARIEIFFVGANDTVIDAGFDIEIEDAP